MHRTELQISDIVKIKHHTESEKNNYPIFWAQTMEQFEGQISTIENIWDEVKDQRSGQKTKAYQIKNVLFLWHGSSLIKMENEHYQTF
jgi:hypothetical protein